MTCGTKSLDFTETFPRQFFLLSEYLSEISERIQVQAGIVALTAQSSLEHAQQPIVMPLENAVPVLTKFLQNQHKGCPL